MKTEKVKLAILDMNDNHPNLGLACIVDIVKAYHKDIDYQIFDVRSKNELPDSSFHIYISSGGPGSPLEDEPWRSNYLELVQELWDYNQLNADSKKYVFFICYSFQVVCDYFGLGMIKPRKSTSFGVLPIHKTKKGQNDPLLEGLDDPFYAVDSRDWQLIQPRLKVFEDHGARILSLEKIRTRVELERAIMAVRFSDEFVGTQFHPEAEPDDLKAYFLDDDNKQIVIESFGEENFQKMLGYMDDMDKLEKTHSTILPKFISDALSHLKQPQTS